MTSSLTLTATRRTITGKHVAKLRHDDLVPAILYGHGVASVPLSIDARLFSRIYRQAGSSSLVDVVVDDQPAVKALIHAVQHHPTRPDVLHIDLYQVRMTETLEAEVELRFVGESPAVKEQGGIFVRSLDKVNVSCLPGDLVPAIDVDISRLKTFEDRIGVSDLIVPKGITIMNKPDEIIATVAAPRSEEEIAELAAAPVAADVADVEVVKKEKAEEETTDETPAPASKPAKE